MMENILTEIINFKHSGNLQSRMKKKEATLYHKLIFLVAVQHNH